MKKLGKILVGSIILLMLTTPLLVSAGVNENKSSSSLNISGDNSIGKLVIVHMPLYRKFLTLHGIGVSWEYIPPQDNPGYDYYFCEVDGEVRMNFSLEVEHRLNVVSPFFTSRYTWINDLWVGKGSVDYFRVEPKEKCEEEFFINYYVNLTEDQQFIPLETNGQNTTIEIWLFFMAAPTDIDAVHTFFELLPNMKYNAFENHGGKISINIHPMQC